MENIGAISDGERRYRDATAKDIADLEKRVTKIEDKIEARNENHIKQMHEMENMFSKLLDDKLKPLLEKYDALDKRIKIVEDRPRDITFRVVCWALAAGGTTIIGLLSILVKAIFF